MLKSEGGKTVINTSILTYRLGEITADLLVVAVGGKAALAAFKLYGVFGGLDRFSSLLHRFNNFAKLHKIASDNPDRVSENLFECLPYLEE